MQYGPEQSSIEVLRDFSSLTDRFSSKPAAGSIRLASRCLRSLRNLGAAATGSALLLSLGLGIGLSQRGDAQTLPNPAPAVHFPTLSAGATSSAPQQITVTAQTSGTIAAVQVLTQGIANADFRDIGGGSCATGQVYFAGQSCTVNVVLQPTYPGFHTGAIVLTSSGGGRLASQAIDGSSRGPLGVIIPGMMSTVAGNGSWTYVTDGVPAVNAPIFLPMGVAVDAAGNIFLSDSSNNRIRRVDATSGLISTIAGVGEPGFSGDGGLATRAAISAPSALALNGAGDLYFADSANHVIRRIDAVTGIINTVAGIGGSQGYSGDGGLATSAQLNQPYGLALDNAQNLYIADTANNVIRKLAFSTGMITTVAGTGVAGYTGDNGLAAAAQLNMPWGLSFVPDSNVSSGLYIADVNNSVIRRITSSGIISTVVGNGTRGFAGDTGPASAALLNTPAAVTVDVAGNLYVGDTGNNRIRKVSVATGNIATISGNAGEAFAGDGGNSDLAGLYGPYALLLDGPGNLYIADMFHNRVRKISSNAAALTYITQRVNRISAPQPETFENDGNADLTLSTLSLDSNSAVDASTTTCFSGAVLTAASSSCTLGVEFAPTTVGNPITGTITLRSNAANTPGVITLSGDVLSVDPTSVTLTSSANPSGLGAPVTFTAHVSTTGTTVTGPIKFLDGTTVLGTSTLGTNGSATLIVSTLALGSHSITAAYAGDSSNAASTSTALTQIVKQPTNLTLVSSLNPSVVSNSVTFTASLTGTTGTPGGTVTFSDGSTTLGIAQVSGGGSASFSTSALAPGGHSITASYSGDTNNLTSTSAALTQTVSKAGTATMLSTSSASVTVGTTVTFTASVSTSVTGAPVPTGSVSFKDGATLLGTGTLDSAGNASFSTAALVPAQHPITAVYQGDNNSVTSTSSALNQTVTQIGTSTTLVSSANPANAGASLTFTANVTAAGGSTAGGALTGTVTFKDGTATLGTGTLSASGAATFTTSSLSVATHAVTAVYAGNTNYATSTSAGVSQVVQQASTTTTLSSSANPAIAGKPVILTATVTGVGGAVTGTVSFKDGATVLGQGSLNAQGVATFSTTSLNVNSHSIIATYNADANNLTSSSTPLSETIQIATTFLSLTSSPNPAIAGVAVTFTSNLTWNGAQPTGAIVFKDGATVLGTLPINGSTPATLTLSNLSVGTHPITASYAGDANDSASVSSTISQVIQQAATTTSISTSQSPIQIGQPITFSSTVLNPSSSLVPTGTVTYLDGATTLGTATLSATGAATFTTSTLGLGNHTITAAYSGDANHSASTSAAITQSVLQATAIALASSANPTTAGNNVTFTAKLTASSSTPITGTVTFKDSGAVLGTGAIDATGSASFSTSALAVGSHAITAVYSGDTNFQTITSTVLTQMVQIATTNIVLTSSINPSVYGSQLTFTTSITGTGGAVTGTVLFKDGTSVLGSATLNNSGVAIFSTTTLSPGMHSITAAYSGDSNNLPYTSAVLQQQVRQTTQTALASSANPGLTLASITYTASVTNPTAQVATGSITFTQGASILGTVSLDINGFASITVPPTSGGQHPIVATYSGDVANLPSVSPTLNEVVNLRSTSTVLTATSTSVTNGQQITLISVVRWTGPNAPTGTVTFTNGTAVVGSSPVDSTGVATLTIILNTAAVNLIASYSGDAAYSPSASAITAVTSGPASQFSLDTSSTNVTVQSKQHITINVTATSIKGFSDTLDFGCLGLPFAATCTFSNVQAKLAADGTQTVTLDIDTGSPLGAGSTASLKAKPSNTMLAFLPIGALLGIALYRSRRRVSLGGLLLILCFLGISLGAVGCGSININGTPPGTYSFKVTAAGMGTGASESKDITLTVTQ